MPILRFSEWTIRPFVSPEVVGVEKNPLPTAERLLAIVIPYSANAVLTFYEFIIF